MEDLCKIIVDALVLGCFMIMYIYMNDLLLCVYRISEPAGNLCCYYRDDLTPWNCCNRASYCSVGPSTK